MVAPTGRHAQWPCPQCDYPRVYRDNDRNAWVCRRCGFAIPDPKLPVWQQVVVVVVAVLVLLLGSAWLLWRDRP